MGDSIGAPYQTVIKETDTSEEVSFRISSFQVIINKQKLKEITGKQLKIRELHERKNWLDALINKQIKAIGTQAAYHPLSNRIILNLNACMVSFDPFELKRVITRALAHEVTHRLNRFYLWRHLLEDYDLRYSKVALKNPVWEGVITVKRSNQ